jgi:glycosyltransferase involved in cell wall biosynthesis
MSGRLKLRSSAVCSDDAAPKIESMTRYDHLSMEPRGLVTQAAGVCAPEVSVVLPTHNRRAQLREAIESVLALDEVDFELIVVDDGSTDETEIELARLNDTRLTVVQLPRSFGANVARNVGIARSRTPYVAFLDSDDIYLPGRLLQPLRILRQAPDIGVVLSSFTTEKRTRRTHLAVPQRIYTGRELLRLMARHVLPPTTSGLTLRKDVLEAIGGFDPTLKRMQDRDLVMRAASCTMGATIADVLWHKRWQEDGISTPQATYIIALIALVERHAIYQNEEREARDYLIARHLLALAKSMRFRQFQRDYSLAQEQLSPPPPPLPRLITRYRNSRRERHQLRQRLLSGEPATGTR